MNNSSVTPLLDNDQDSKAGYASSWARKQNCAWVLQLETDRKRVKDVRGFRHVQARTDIDSVSRCWFRGVWTDEIKQDEDHGVTFMEFDSEYADDLVSCIQFELTHLAKTMKMPAFTSVNIGNITDFMKDEKQQGRLLGIRVHHECLIAVVNFLFVDKKHKGAVPYSCKTYTSHDPLADGSRLDDAKLSIGSDVTHESAV